MKRLLVALTLLLGLACGPTAYAENACADSGANINSSVINVGAATTALIVAVQGTQPVHVCGFSASLAGTTPTVKFVIGTQVTNPCDTNASTISGVFAPTSGQMITAGWGGDILVVPAGDQLCATTVGTGSSFQGILTWTAP